MSTLTVRLQSLDARLFAFRPYVDGSPVRDILTGTDVSFSIEASSGTLMIEGGGSNNGGHHRIEIHNGGGRVVRLDLQTFAHPYVSAYHFDIATLV
ncbi:hypothetical protein JYT86_00565 [bacterium AH-315-N03]|nr:hypothetical protein [bacterium AH-315-N03]